MFIYFEKKCKYTKIFIIHKMYDQTEPKKILIWDTETVMAQLS
jgi:hypothetical protein